MPIHPLVPLDPPTSARPGWRPRLSLVAFLLVLAGCGDPLPEPDPIAEEALAALPTQTPLAGADYSELTLYEPLMEFVEALAVSPRVTLDTLGTSVEGRSIPYLKVGLGEFGAQREDRVLVLAFAQQHGNEPAGKEGALKLALELARGDHDELLRHVDLILVPQVNPDGGEIHQRQNAEGVDLNRSHLILDGPESRALRELFHRWEPEVAVDIHEYSPWSGAWLDEGWLRLFDMQIGLPTNLNVPEEIRDLAHDGFLAFATEALEGKGFTAHNYIVGSPESLRWSTTNVNDGRQGLAILNTLSFIVEGKRSEPRAEDMRRRAEVQRLTLESLLRFSAENRIQILNTVRGARERVREGEVEDFVLTMRREAGDGPLEIPVESVHRDEDGEWVVGDTVTARIEGWLPDIVADRVIPLPPAYLIPAGQDEVIALLEAHQVEIEVLDADMNLTVEQLTILGFIPHDLEGMVEIPETRAQEGNYRTAEGDVLVRTAQLRGLMVATALEPESMHGLLRYDRFESLATEGPFPIFRVTELP